jgi:hypothetical protein
MCRPTKDERMLLLALGSFVFLLIGGCALGAWAFGRAWAYNHSPEARAYFEGADRARLAPSP